MEVVVFLDLDDTLFQTLPKCPPGETCRPAAFHRDGTPLSFMTDRQVRLLDLFRENATVIPVTARNLGAFRRVNLTFRSLAILDFGGIVLLPDGQPDPVWLEHIQPQALAMRNHLEMILEKIQTFNSRRNLGIRARLIADFALPLYLVMKHPEGNLANLDLVRTEQLPGLDLGSFFVHGNGNNLSLVPNYLGKERAVNHVLQHHLDRNKVLTIGVGDSLTDLPFLKNCDFMMVPRNSQAAWAISDCRSIGATDLKEPRTQ